MHTRMRARLSTVKYLLERTIDTATELQNHLESCSYCIQQDDSNNFCMLGEALLISWQAAKTQANVVADRKML